MKLIDKMMFFVDLMQVNDEPECYDFIVPKQIMDDIDGDPEKVNIVVYRISNDVGLLIYDPCAKKRF